VRASQVCVVTEESDDASVVDSQSDEAAPPDDDASVVKMESAEDDPDESLRQSLVEAFSAALGVRDGEDKS